jgi:RNA polymerase sigma-70 factor (ECF subfamily)
MDRRIKKPAAAATHVQNAVLMAAAPYETPDHVERVDALFRAHARFVWRTLRHLGVADADLDDQCQEVFVVVHRRLAEFEQRSGLTTWLYGICLRVARDYRRRAHRRREKREQDAGASVAVGTGEHAPAERVEQRRQIQQLYRALDTLDHGKRAVFVLYEIEELTMREVSEIVGCKLHTAYRRLYSARKQVARELGFELGESKG